MYTTTKSPVNGLEHRNQAQAKSPEAFQDHASIRAWCSQRTWAVQPAPITLIEMLDSYLLDAMARQLFPKTLNFYQQQLRPFLAYVAQFGVERPEQLTARHIRAYLVSLRQRELSDNSIHAAARAIRAFCNFMVNEDVLTESPMRKVQMPRRSKRILPAFTPEEMEKLVLACTHPRDRAIILFLADTGCRASEFVALNEGDVDLREGIVVIREGKGRKDRVVYMGVAARRELARYFRERGEMWCRDPLWISLTTAKRLTTSGLRILLRRVGKRAGVDHCHPHTFRRTCALWSLRAGMDIYRLQRIMGHADLTMLQRYLALAHDDVQEAHRKHGAVDSVFDGSLIRPEGDS